MASAGTSGATHVAGELFKALIASTCYRGDASALIDLTGGQVAPAQLVTAVSQLLKTGKPPT